MKVIRRTSFILPLLVVVFFVLSTSEAFADEDYGLLMKGLIFVLWNFVVSVLGLFVGWAGSMLNASIENYIINFGALYTGGGGAGLGGGIGHAIETSWSTVRDFFNMFFIFGLVYLGFKMILGSDESGTKRWLVSLIMAALLVNFSLFITKVIVDFTNLLTAEIYSGFGRDGLADAFMKLFGIQKILKVVPVAGAAPESFAIVFGTAFVFLIAIFVFAAGALMVAIRFVALSLYMVMSPLMFLGWVFPQLSNISSKYWTGFLGRAFFAPIFVLLNYFGFVIISQLSIGINIDAAVGTPSETTSQDLLPFIIASGFMIASIVVANKLGADGASQAMKIGNNIKNGAQKRLNNGARWGARTVASPVTGSAGWVAKRTSNALGNRLNQNLERWQNADKSTPSGRLQRKIAGNAWVDDVTRGTATKLKSNKFGNRFTVDEAERKQAAINSRISTNDTVREGLGARKRLAQGQDAIVKDTEIYDYANSRVVEKNSFASQADLEKFEKENEAAKAALERSVGEMQSAVGDMSVKQLEAMLDNQSEIFGEIIGEMKPGQVDKLIDSDAIPQNIKDAIGKRRQETIENTLIKNGKVVSDQITKLSIKQIETLGDQFIRDNAEHFTESQMDAIGKSDSFSDQQKGSYKGIRKKNRVAHANGSNIDDKKSLFYNVENYKNEKDPITKKMGLRPEFAKTQKKASETANLPAEVLLHESSLPYITQSILEEIFAKKTLDGAQRNTLRDNIMNKPGATQEAKDYLNSPLGRRNWNNPESATPATPALSAEEQRWEDAFNQGRTPMFGSIDDQRRHAAWLSRRQGQNNP